MSAQSGPEKAPARGLRLLIGFCVRHRVIGPLPLAVALGALTAGTAILVGVAFAIKLALTDLTAGVRAQDAVRLAAICVGLLIARLLVDLLDAAVLSRAAAQATNALREEIFARLESLPGAAFREPRFGADTTALFAADAQVMQDFLSQTAPRLIQSLLLGIGSVATMALLEWRLTVICIATLLLALPVNRLFSTRLQRALGERQAGDTGTLALVDEAVVMHPVIRAFRLGEAWRERFRRALTTVFGPQRRAIGLSRLYVGTMGNVANTLIFTLLVAPCSLC